MSSKLSKFKSRISYAVRIFDRRKPRIYVSANEGYISSTNPAPTLGSMAGSCIPQALHTDFLPCAWEYPGTCWSAWETSAPEWLSMACTILSKGDNLKNTLWKVPNYRLIPDVLFFIFQSEIIWTLRNIYKELAFIFKLYGNIMIPFPKSPDDNGSFFTTIVPTIRS